MLLFHLFHETDFHHPPKGRVFENPLNKQYKHMFEISFVDFVYTFKEQCFFFSYLLFVEFFICGSVRCLRSELKACQCKNKEKVRKRVGETVGGREHRAESIIMLLNLFCEIHEICSPYINKIK